MYIRCPNSECPAQVKERVRYFAARNAMDIEGLGDKLVDQLVSTRLVKGYGDLYRPTVDQLMEIERMGKKSSESLVGAIESSKSRGLARLLNALSIRHVGARVATVLAEHFGSMEKLRAASSDDLSEVNEVGPVIAAGVYAWLQREFGKRTIDDLTALGVQMTALQSASQTGQGVLAGKTFVVTGTLEKYGREDIEELIARHGGRAASSVSKKTSYLIAGADAGSKLAKAQQLGVEIIDEAKFEQMIAAEGH